MHGVLYDQLDSLTPADKWTDGRNMYFYAGESRRVPGERKFPGTTRVCDADVIEYVDNGAQAWWVYACARSGGDMGIGATNGTDHYEITPVGWVAIATKGLILTIGNINNIVFVNHPELGPFYWDGNTASDCVKLPGWPAAWTCRVMRAHKEFLMAIAVDTEVGLAEGQVSWSASADPYTVPQEWVPTAINDAGDATFSSPGGPLVDGLSVRDQFFVAKGDYTGALQYIGGSLVFQKRDIFPSMGVLSPGAWCENGNMVFQVTGELEIVRHDGTSYENLLYGVAQVYFRNALNSEYSGNVMVVPDNARGQIIVCYPTGTAWQCTEAINIEALTGDACIRDLPGVTDYGFGLTEVQENDWDSDPEAWEDDTTTWNQGASGYQPKSIVFAGGQHGGYEVAGGNDTWVDGVQTPINAWLGRQGMDFDVDHRKTVSGLVPQVVANSGTVITFSVTGQEIEGGSVDGTGDMPFTVGVDRQLDFFVDARLVGIQLSTIGGPEWGMGAMRPFVRKAGR